MKIPFDIKYRPQIESGEYKVVTRDGKQTRIICWDRKYGYPICGLAYEKATGCENYVNAYENGMTAIGGIQERNDDLFIITPEPEFSEFEKELESFYNHHLQVCTYDNQGTVEDSLHDGASKLLALAREQFIKDGYIIEKKAFHDAVENISDKHEAEMYVEYSLHCKVENETRHAVMNWESFQKLAQKFIDIGKAEALKEIEQDPEGSPAFKCGFEYGKEEALKDLPRWKKIKEEDTCARVPHVSTNMIGEKMLYIGNYAISISRLEKLPGFNE